ncbi:MAG: EamA family transporter [Planctomycetota bacterium]
MSRTPMPIHGYALAFTAAVLWGLLYVLDERLLAGVSIYRLYFLHSLAGLTVAGAVLLAQGESPASLLRFSWPGVGLPLVIATMVVVVLACLAIFASIQALGAARAAVLEISYPFFVALFAWLLYRQPFTWPVMLGGLLIFAGSAVIVVGSHRVSPENPAAAAPDSAAAAR